MMGKNSLFTMFLGGIWITTSVFWAPSATGDATIGCVSETLSTELTEMTSVTDITESSASAHLIIELPVRFSNLVLEYIHLRRSKNGIRVLWVGLPFEELNKNKSWSTVEISRSDLNEYELSAQYHSEKAAQDDCFYEFPVALQHKE